MRQKGMYMIQAKAHNKALQRTEYFPQESGHYRLTLEVVSDENGQDGFLLNAEMNHSHLFQGILIKPEATPSKNISNSLPQKSMPYDNLNFCLISFIPEILY